MARMRRFIWPVMIILTILIMVYAGFQISKSRTFQFFGEIIPSIETQQKIIALTFDDGPVPGATEEILGILDQGGIRATFFLTGAELQNNPDLGRKIAAAGHEIGNHSFSHTRMVFKSPSFIRTEVEDTDRLIRQTGYQGPIHFRPPFGKKLILLPYYLSQTGRKSILWDLEPDSYPVAEAESIVQYVIDRAKPGSIILLHVMYPSRRESLKAVPGIIAGMKKEGYGFKTVSNLLAAASK